MGTKIYDDRIVIELDAVDGVEMWRSVMHDMVGMLEGEMSRSRATGEAPTSAYYYCELMHALIEFEGV